MPVGPQPRGARGTHGHPYSALSLRLVLAVFGVLSCAALVWLALWAGRRALAVLLVVLGAVALVDAVVIELRRRSAARSGAARGVSAGGDRDGDQDGGDRGAGRR